jgi:hypothetical protein
MFRYLHSLSRSQQILVLIGLSAVLWHLAYIVQRTAHQTGDYHVNREFGRRFLAGESLYEGGLCFNYMPISALYYAPLALLPATVGLVVRYLAALGCLVLVLRWLQQMNPAVARTPFAVAAVTLVLAAHYLARDFDDGGAHTLLLTLLVGGAWCLWRGRHVLGATWFGLAIALKMTPALLLPFLLWKRQWRTAALTVVAVVAWVVLPAVWLGWQPWWAEQQKWNQVVIGMALGKPSPAMEDNDLHVQNQSLKLALLHGLRTYPEGHPLNESQTGWHGLDLNPRAASMLTMLLMGGLFGGFCHIARPDTGLQEAAWPVEFAGLWLLMLLLSPVTWVQHLVWTVPALYALMAVDLRARPWGGAVMVLLAVWAVVVLGLNRELLGKATYLMLLGNHLHTACLLTLLGLVVWLRLTKPRAVAAAQVTLPDRRTPLAA